MTHSGKFVAIFLALVIAIAITEVHGKKIYYTHEGIHEKAKEVCCGGAQGKRDVEKIEKEDASAFLNYRREKRGSDLRTECCHSGSCSQEEVIETSLREECIDEGCHYEEIEEACH